MPEPVLRSTGQLVSSLSGSLNVPIGATSPGDFVVIYTRLTNYSSTNVGYPTAPPGWTPLYATGSTTQATAVYYRAVTSTSFPSTVTLQLPEDAGTSTAWIAFAEVFSDVSYRTPGWISMTGEVGDYAEHNGSDFGSSATSVTFEVRVQLNELGVEQWFTGWDNNDAAFGLDATNRPIAYLTNTVGDPIGNVAANADIPGLVTGQRIWLHVEISAADAQCRYHYSFDDVENRESVHWTIVGSGVFGTNAGTTIRLSNTNTVYIGTDDPANPSFEGRIFNLSTFRPGIAYDLIHKYSDPLPGSVTLVGDADHVVPTSDDGDASPIEDWEVGTYTEFTDDFHVPAREVYGSDRLVYNAWVGARSFEHSDFPVSGPEGWDVYPDRASTSQNVAQKVIVRTIVADADIPDVPATSDDQYLFWFFGLTLRGRADLILFPTSPEPDRLQLGCADSYTVWLTDSTYDQTIDEVRCSGLRWGRVLDEISQARVVLPDRLGGASCLANLGGVQPWKYGVRIERNDIEVWSGPIVTVQRSGAAIELGCADIFARYQKRFLTRTKADFIDTDAGTAFREAIEVYAFLNSDPWVLRVPSVNIGVGVTRHLNPKEFKYAWDFLSELLESSIDAYIMNGRVYIFEPGAGWRYQAVIKRTLEGPYNTNYDFVYGTFTEEAWSQRPDWSIDGAGQSNYNVVPSTDSGEYGFRTFEVAEDVESQDEFGVLDAVDPDPLELPQDIDPVDEIIALRARAETVNALRSRPPIVVEGGTLSQQAPVDVDNLRPGSLWKIDVWDQGFGQLLTVGRLRRITVDVTITDKGITEQIVPMLTPPGWQGALP